MFSSSSRDVTDITHQKSKSLRDLCFVDCLPLFIRAAKAHAIVRIDAIDYTRSIAKRVDFYIVSAKKTAFKVDKQNKNPSRLSRMPGVMRNGEKTYFARRYRERIIQRMERMDRVDQRHDLPDPESVADVGDNPLSFRRR